MNDHALKVLEFEKVRDIVAGYAVSSPGRAAVLALLPANDRGLVSALLDETRECMRLLASGERLPLDGIADVGPSIGKLSVSGVTLQPPELLAISSTLGTARRLRSFFQRFEPADGPHLSAPLLSAKAAMITPLRHLEDAVHEAIDETGEIRDSASPELRRIRKLITRTRDGIIERLTRILRDAGTQNIIQEQLITVRDDRYVMPLKPNFRQGIKGVVHGHSGSRATLFVEPLEVVDQNNRLSELRMEERDELERILRELTGRLAAEAPDIDASFSAVTGIDAVQARARFGIEYGGAVPALSAQGRLMLRSARHPLIIAKKRAGAVQEAVPNDIELSRDIRSLIISGPNAGGKTVILKTIGILCLMAQSGIPVTAAEGSELPAFGDVFADIGDEQSLEQDLSTFSSHVSQIAAILSGLAPDSLVLLDELGSGTDPAEGAALGAAILGRLLGTGCMSVITTHHSGLKLFGARTIGAFNAAMEFDPVTLKPTYRFIPGRPGRSYGLDMAARLGVPEQVVRDARSRLTGDEAALDLLLEQVEREGRALRDTRQQAEQELANAKRLTAEAEQLRGTAAEEERTAKAQAKTEARSVLAALRQKLKDLSRAATFDRAAVAQERREIEALAEKLEPVEETYVPRGSATLEVHPGDRVRMPRLKKTGTVLFASHDSLEVEADGVRFRLPLREVAPAGPLAVNMRSPSASGWNARLEEREGAPDRLNLLGLRVDEALLETEKFLDHATVQGYRQVTVIHGLGTGALKAAVTAYLKGHPHIASFWTGEPSEGGAGVTIVELKT